MEEPDAGVTAAARDVPLQRGADGGAAGVTVDPEGIPAVGHVGTTSDSADVLRSLGLEALVEIVETSGYGICVTGEDHRWLYLNPTGCRLVGRPFAELHGEDYLLSFAEHERAALLALEQDQRGGDTGFYTNTIVRPDGSEIGITWSGSVLHVGDRELAPAVFHPTSALRRAEREAEVLGAAAARVAEGGSVEDVLASLAMEAVAGSRAVACAVLVEDDAGRLAVVARAGVPRRVAAVFEAAALRLADLPGGDLLTAGRLLLLSDDRSRLAAAPATAEVATGLGDLAWEGSVKVPLQRRGQVVGCVVLLLPPSVTAPTESEVAFWAALGAHASVALADERLRAQAVAYAADLERQRLGRDLHDSVSAALFSVHARAQAVSRAVAAGDQQLAATAAHDLEALSREAISQLRAMVTGMRDDRTAAAGDVTAALREVAATCTARDGLPVRLQLPDSAPAVDPATVEHLVRIAGEALHNCVKHAAATAADVALDVRGSELVLSVSDDGRGFDPTLVRPERHGQRTMRERALLCGGWLHVDSAPGRGTRVVVRVPLPG